MPLSLIFDVDEISPVAYKSFPYLFIAKIGALPLF